MQRCQITNNVSRREFLKSTAAVAAIATGVPITGATPAFGGEAVSDSRAMGIQVGAVSFADEGTGRVLDILQEQGAINTLFLTTFTYGRGLAGRQIPGSPFPDHGVQESDEKFFHGGNYALPHAEFYRDTVLKQTRAPDHGDLDIVAAVLPEAKKRGMHRFQPRSAGLSKAQRFRASLTQGRTPH